MGKIYCIIGKSSSGKDTIYKKLIQDKDLNLHHIVPYTTRPIREGEKEGIEYHFTDEATLQKYRDHNKLVECRAYQTIYGIWYYYTVKDDQIDLSKYSYLRLTRAFQREKSQSVPKYEEMCRRFLADSQDFSKEKLEEAGISRAFYNNELDSCIQEIKQYIQENDRL